MHLSVPLFAYLYLPWWQPCSNILSNLITSFVFLLFKKLFMCICTYIFVCVCVYNAYACIFLYSCIYSYLCIPLLICNLHCLNCLLKYIVFWRSKGWCVCLIFFSLLLSIMLLKNILPNPRSLRFSFRCSLVSVLHLYLRSNCSYYFGANSED